MSYSPGQGTATFRLRRREGEQVRSRRERQQISVRPTCGYMHILAYYDLRQNCNYHELLHCTEYCLRKSGISYALQTQRRSLRFLLALELSYVGVRRTHSSKAGFLSRGLLRGVLKS